MAQVSWQRACVTLNLLCMLLLSLKAAPPIMFNRALVPSMMSLPLKPALILAQAEESEQRQRAGWHNKKVYCFLFSKKAGTKRLARELVSLCA
jgi:hypothetical protein